MNHNIHLLKIFNRARIKQQLYLMYAIVVVLPIILIGVFLLGNSYRLMVNYHKDLLESDNRRARNVLFEITTQIYNISENISFNDDIRNVLTGSFLNESDCRDSISRITLLDNYISNYAEIRQITIYTDNPAITGYKQFEPVTPQIAQTDWYQKGISQSGIFWSGMSREDSYSNEYWNLCLVRKIPLVNSPYHAVLVLSISDDYLRTRIDNSEYISIISADEEAVFYSTDRRYYGGSQPMLIDHSEPYFQYSGQMRQDGRQCLIHISTLHTYQSDSRLYITTIDRQGFLTIRSILSFCIAIMIVAILIPGILIHIFTDYFTGRVMLLRQEMHKASNQDYELISSFQGNDELSEAFADLQVMVQNIKEQEAKTYEAQIKEKELLISQREMEFKMLASQINPHFLYNTLETIRMKAFTAGDKEAATAIKLLGKSMRYVLDNTGTSFTTLGRELDHVDTYITIQQLRFGDRFQYVKRIEDGVGLHTLRILPLLLQPIVENAILHGLEDISQGGIITLSVYRKTHGDSELLYIDVTDNGNGMTQETLQKLRLAIEEHDMSRSKSIGLYNINQRIKLCYGETCRLHLYSEPHKGTTVRLMLPMEQVLSSV
ncbi:MAG: histidine kinase [Lachnospiraceae bacterium]|nr:histidine kinase [Lachnospiraceae bacterium]